MKLMYVKEKVRHSPKRSPLKRNSVFSFPPSPFPFFIRDKHGICLILSHMYLLYNKQLQIAILYVLHIICHEESIHPPRIITVDRDVSVLL